MARIDPHSHTDPDQGVVTHADLELAVDFPARVLRGRVKLTLDGATGGALDLDTRDLVIQQVLDGDGKPLKWSLGAGDPVLGARLRIDAPEGTKTIRVDYGTSPEASALQWLDPSNTAGKEHPYLFSQCQPHHARSMLPIQDSARVRFSYRAAISVPRPLVAVMSAAPGEKHSGEGGLDTFNFEMPQPIPAYLLALAVGNIASRDLGPRSRVYAEPETLDAAAWEFAGTDAALLKAEQLFGDYRWDRYDFLMMPPAFPYGGMENPRLTFLTPSLLAGDRSLVNVLAHELAHSWTGNLVTNATMNDFWLNEGFTVWAERRILELLEGDEAVALSAAIGREGLDADLERFGADSPYTRLRTDLEGVDPDEVYSLVPYEKGFLFVALLERTVGRERFDGFVRDYMDRFAFTSITTEEFLVFLEEKLPGVADEVSAERWIYQPGVPENAPSFESTRLTALTELAAGWSEDSRPDVDQAKAWPVAEWLVYLGALPKGVTADECRWLDERFELTQSNNAEILCRWLTIALDAGYPPALDKVGEFLGTTGRMKFLKPLYGALTKRATSRSLASELYARYQDRYHPIARAGLEALLGASA